MSYPNMNPGNPNDPSQPPQPGYGAYAPSQQAQQSPRQRANCNLHPQLDDPIQRLAIAMEPGTYVRPHRHPHTWELLYPLRGRFLRDWQ